MSRCRRGSGLAAALCLALVVPLALLVLTAWPYLPR